MKNYNEFISIKQWAEEDRPREKLLNKGKKTLSNAELIAILIGTGSKNETAVDLAKKILRTHHDNLNELSKISVTDLIKFNGIGKAKAIIIIAALELANRRRSATVLSRIKITCSKDAFDILKSHIGDAQYEEFWIMLLNRANKVLQNFNISEGGISGTVADPRKIFKIAIENNASSIVLCHNHPSGNVQPSESDIKLTHKLKDAGDHLDIQVIDHIIIGENQYFSFADENIL
jgi:DNA repair protein RadC